MNNFLLRYFSDKLLHLIYLDLSSGFQVLLKYY